MLNLSRFFRQRPTITEQTSPPSPTLAELSELWLTKDRLGDRWRKEARRLLARNVLPHLGARGVDAITRLHVCELLERLNGDGNYNNTRAVISRVYAWAHETGRINCPNPVAGLKKRKLIPRDRTLTDTELMLLWRECVTLGDFGRICRLILLTGCRPGEIGGLTWENVQFDHPSGPALYLPHPKNGKPHTVPLTSLAVENLPEPRPSFPNLFGGIRGKAFNGWSMGRELWLFRQLPAKPWSPHDLRKTAATRLGDLGVPDDVIERIQGHSAQTVSRKHYNHSQKLAQQREALERWSVELMRIVGSEQKRRNDPEA